MLNHASTVYSPPDNSNYYLYGIDGSPRHSKYYKCMGFEQRLSDCDSYTDTTIRTQCCGTRVYCDAGKLTLAIKLNT